MEQERLNLAQKELDENVALQRATKKAEVEARKKEKAEKAAAAAGARAAAGAGAARLSLAVPNDVLCACYPPGAGARYRRHRDWCESVVSALRRARGTCRLSFLGVLARARS